MPGLAGAPEVPALEPLEPMLPVTEPDAPVPDPAVLPVALPLMPPLAAGAELELLEELPGAVLSCAGGVTVTEVLELDDSRAAGALEELELALPEGALGAVLEPVLLLEELAGGVALLDFCAGDGPRSQPVTASAIATAAATSVRWVSLCIAYLLWVGGVGSPRLAQARWNSTARDTVLRDLFRS